jgi:hypothetical protein
MEPNNPFTLLANRMLAGSVASAKLITTEKAMHLNQHSRRPQKLMATFGALLMLTAAPFCTSTGRGQQGVRRKYL